jgi:hypothetical protein
VVSPTCNSLAGRGQFTEGTLACPPGREPNLAIRGRRAHYSVIWEGNWMLRTRRRSWAILGEDCSSMKPSRRQFVALTAPALAKGQARPDRRIEDSFAPAAIRMTREPRLTS